MAPALLVAQGARFVDLDGPLLLARDREPGLHYHPDGRVAPRPPSSGADRKRENPGPSFLAPDESPPPARETLPNRIVGNDPLGFRTNGDTPAPPLRWRDCRA